MARLSNAPFISRPTLTSNVNPASIELAQLLSRLQQSILRPTPERERRIRTSEFERAKLEKNLEYARTLLTRLEQGALEIKAPGKRSEVQGSLNQQREILESLMDRLDDFKHMAIEGDDTSEGEDILSEIIPTPSDSMDSRAGEGLNGDADQDTTTTTLPEPPQADQFTAPEPELPPKSPETSQTAYTSQTTHTTQTLRSRPNAPSPSQSQSSAHTTARAALFANRRKPAAPKASTATAEAILDQQRSEQDALSESILKMASALKASSQKFSTTLDADKGVLGQAVDGMGKTERGMEAARGRMGALRRMTEGKGWWGRMILYAWVYGLMVALVLLVFVLPKL